MRIVVLGRCIRYLLYPKGERRRCDITSQREGGSSGEAWRAGVKHGGHECGVLVQDIVQKDEMCVARERLSIAGCSVMCCDGMRTCIVEHKQYAGKHIHGSQHGLRLIWVTYTSIIRYQFPVLGLISAFSASRNEREERVSWWTQHEDRPGVSICEFDVLDSMRWQ